MRLGPLFTALLLTSTGVAGWYWAKQPPASATDAAQKGPGGGGRRGAAQGAGPIPVTVTRVAARNVPVYREGIGNVVALAMVTVRAQIDGRLMSVEFTEGQELRQGTVLARIDPTIYKAQFDQAVAKKAQDQATLANARLDLERYQRLALTNAGPKQQADQQRAIVAQLEAQVKSDDAAIDNAKAVLGYTTIASPIDGRAGLRLVDPGNIVRAGDANGLVTITQLKPIAIVFTLPQRDMAAIAVAMARGKIAVEVMQADGTGVLAQGALETIDNQIDVTTGTIKLKAQFANDDQKLWPGQFVSARVVVDTLADAKIVPTSAIRRGPAGTFVYAISAEGKAVVTPVKVALQDEQQAVIGDGLEVGAEIVTAGFQRLSDGKVVEITGGGTPAPAGSEPSKGEPRGEGAAPKDAAGAAPGGATDGQPAQPARGERKRDGAAKSGDGKGGGGKRRRDGEAAAGAPTGGKQP